MEHDEVDGTGEELRGGCYMPGACLIFSLLRPRLLAAYPASNFCGP